MTSWEEIYERMAKLEKNVELFGRMVEKLDKQMKAWKKKFPGS